MPELITINEMKLRLLQTAFSTYGCIGPVQGKTLEECFQPSMCLQYMVFCFHTVDGTIREVRMLCNTASFSAGGGR